MGLSQRSRCQGLLIPWEQCPTWLDAVTPLLQHKGGGQGSEAGEFQAFCCLLPSLPGALLA